MDRSKESNVHTIRAFIQEAEEHLVSKSYNSAESSSLKALESLSLQNTTESSATTLYTLGDRAAIVFLQCAFETSRFSMTRPCLCTTFGSLESSPPNSLLLWLSLALDTDEHDHATTLTLQLLQSKTPRNKRWTRRQYLALLHLYIIEMLLPALRDPSEVCLWLHRQTFLPLDPRESHFLEQEVHVAAAAKTNDDSFLSLASGGGSTHGDELMKHVRRRAPATLLPALSGSMDSLLSTHEREDDTIGRHPMRRGDPGSIPRGVPGSIGDESLGQTTGVGPDFHAIISPPDSPERRRAMRSPSPHPSPHQAIMFHTNTEYATSHGDTVNSSCIVHHHQEERTGARSAPAKRREARADGSALSPATTATGSGGGSLAYRNNNSSSSSNTNNPKTLYDLDWLGKSHQLFFDGVNAMHHGVSSIADSLSKIVTSSPVSYYWNTGESCCTADAINTTIDDRKKKSLKQDQEDIAIQGGLARERNFDDDENIKHQQSKNVNDKEESYAGMPNPPSARAVLAGVSVVLVAYAAYVERKSIKEALYQASKDILRHVNELTAMGMSLSPNPMMAPRS